MRAASSARQAPGLYWLDVVAYDIDLRQRHSRIALILLVMVVLLAAGLGVSVASH